ncbi:hypothetical protein AZE42_02740 [Rhizopogon vesiculosus]|uniref:Uncharacterized protein n=1 Tax=Rhizopogon vesiculosus TaxID=180088 RepID=A0A1J8QVQ7_9AGAM|nr:hypothetical protein AZE42_02740 [Rhizopogon vesiculosus]
MKFKAGNSPFNHPVLYKEETDATNELMIDDEFVQPTQHLLKNHAKGNKNDMLDVDERRYRTDLTLTLNFLK